MMVLLNRPAAPSRAARLATLGVSPGLRLLVAGLALLLALASPVRAHEGHDHGEERPAAANLGAMTPRASAQSELYEIVAVLKNGELIAYLDRYADNAPVTGAELTLAMGSETLKAEPRGEGLYRFAAPALANPGRHEFVFSVSARDGDDLLVTVLETPATVGNAVQGATAQRLAADAVWVWALIAAVLVLGISLRLRRTRRGSLVLLAALAAAALAGSQAWGHEGHDHGPTPDSSAMPAGDSPRRLPDGSVFLPKPSQRLLEVRTLLAHEEKAQSRRSLVGRVIANPNRSALVQSTVGGRFQPTAAGLPRLGHAVQAGEVLGQVLPGFRAEDLKDVRQTAGDLDQQIALAEVKVQRARRLYATQAGSRVQLEDAEIQLEGLRKRRQAITASEAQPESLVAPIAGVIASVRAVPGQVVGTQDVLFRIVDPSSLWVEAYVFDPALNLDTGQATAIVQDGKSLELTFIGRSRALQQQAAIVQFEIAEPPPTLNVGTPVTVLAKTGQPVAGIVLPKSAVTRSANGEDIVWNYAKPEQFVPKPIHLTALDGERVLVLRGVRPGDRIVVSGTELINQVR